MLQIFGQMHSVGQICDIYEIPRFIDGIFFSIRIENPSESEINFILKHKIHKNIVNKENDLFRI